MPRAALSRQTYAGFRAADYSSPTSECYVAFSEPWDLEKVEPDPFPVPVLGRLRASSPNASTEPSRGPLMVWKSTHGKPGSLVTAPATVAAVTGEEATSPYKERFRAGAVLFPRMLLLRNGRTRPSVGRASGPRSDPITQASLDKQPWKDLPEQTGVVESIFIRPAYLGESIAPFRVLSVPEAVIPFDGTTLMDGASERIDRYGGLADWWRGRRRSGKAHRSSEKRTLIEQIDYMKQLSAQFPIAPWRVVYTASGNTLAATVIRTPRA